MNDYEVALSAAVRSHGFGASQVAAICHIAVSTASLKLNGHRRWHVSELNALARAGVVFPPFGAECVGGVA